MERKLDRGFWNERSHDLLGDLGCSNEKGVLPNADCIEIGFAQDIDTMREQGLGSFNSWCDMRKTKQ